MALQTVGIGSLPKNYQNSLGFSLKTRPQFTSLPQNQNMFWEFELLASGQDPLLKTDTDPILIQKAQLPGLNTLATTIRSNDPIYRAIEQLLRSHPNLETIWFDEPILHNSMEPYKKLFAKLTQRFSVTWGLHTCGKPNISFLLKLPIEQLSIDTWLLSEQNIALLRKNKEKNIIWGIIPTIQHLSDPQIITKLLTLPINKNHDFISTTCGLGGLTPLITRARLQQLHKIARIF